MQTKIEGAVNSPTDAQAQASERRTLINAGKQLIDYKSAAVLPAHGVTPQNFYIWMKGTRDSALSDDKQKVVMQLYGFLPSGKLAHLNLHSWMVRGPEQLSCIETMLTHELDVKNVHICPAYTNAHARRRDPTEMQRSFIGTAVTWMVRDGVTEWPRRLIITVVHDSVPAEKLLSWLSEKAFGPRLAAGESVTIDPAIEVQQSAAQSVWRWNLKARTADGGRATLPPNKGLLAFDEDIIGKPEAATESPLSVLQDMAPRFKRNLESASKAKGKPVHAADLSLMRRADAVLKSLQQ